MTAPLAFDSNGVQSVTFSQGDATWTKYRERALTDLYWFADVVLGYGTRVPMREYAHRALCRIVEGRTGCPAIDDANVQRLELPREWGKTTVISQARVIQLIAENPDISILLCNEKEGNAKDFLSAIKWQFESNDFLRALFPEIIPPDFNATVWSASRIVVNRKSGRKEPTVFVIGVGGTVTGMHPDVILVDDMISREAMENARAGSWQIMQQTNRWINQLRPLVSKQYARWRIYFIGCIGEGQRVLMADGAWKAIETIQVGERVWSWGKDQQAFAPQVVTAVVSQGLAETMTVRSGKGKHELRTTVNHPFLSRTSVGKELWKRADQLKPASRVQTLAALPDQTQNHALDFCWLMGFLLGDGWVTKHETLKRLTYSVCCALSVYPRLNAKILRLMRKYLGDAVYETASGYYRIDKQSAGKLVETFGLLSKVRAPNKTLPDWVRGVTAKEKRAFLRGLLAADGFEQKGKKLTLRLSTSSKNLAEETRMLAFTCGVRPTTVYTRTRTIQPPNSPKPVASTEYSVGFVFGHKQQQLYETRASEHGERRTETVWDLSVANTQNFICEGFVVHNTRWWHGDSYDHIDLAYGYNEQSTTYTLRIPMPPDSPCPAWGNVQVLSATRMGDLVTFRRAAIENGRSTFPEKWTLEDLARMRLVDEALFSCNMMNNPSDDKTATFKASWLQTHTWVDDRNILYTDTEGKKKLIALSDLDVLMLVDPGGFSARNTEDRARPAVLVVGDDRVGMYHVLDIYNEKDTFLAAIQQIVSWCTRYRPRKIYTERAGQQAAFAQLLRVALRDAALDTVVDDTTLKPGVTQKDVRILALEPYFQRGQFTVGTGPAFHTFREQYSQFPRTTRKDVLDVLAYVPRVVKPKAGVNQSRQNAARQETERAAYRARRGMGRG